MLRAEKNGFSAARITAAVWQHNAIGLYLKNIKLKEKQDDDHSDNGVMLTSRDGETSKTYLNNKFKDQTMAEWAHAADLTL